MYENREQRRHSKCRDNAVKFLYRPRCKWTGDDTGTVFGICVSVLIVLAGTLGYIICVSGLMTVVCVLVPLADFLKMQACPSASPGPMKCAAILGPVRAPGDTNTEECNEHEYSRTIRSAPPATV